MGVLDSLLEGAAHDVSREVRGPHGRWIATFSHHVHGTITQPIEARSSEEAFTKARALRLGTVQKVEPAKPRVSALNPQTKPEAIHAQYAADRAAVRGDAARRARAFDPVTMLGREGTAARERGASSLTSEHADTRDKLTNLPVGQTYGLHGPRGQVGRVDRTAKGFEVYGPHAAEPKVHKSPSSAAGHAMRIQRSAAQSPRHADVAKRNYSHHQQVAAMNARQAQRSDAERERQLEITARTSSSSRERAVAQTELDRLRGARTPRPRVREAAPAVLAALLEG